MCFSISRRTCPQHREELLNIYMLMSGLQFKVAGWVRSACCECHVDTHGGLGDHWVQALDTILSIQLDYIQRTFVNILYYYIMLRLWYSTNSSVCETLQSTLL